MKKKQSNNNTIALNKKARHDYQLISKFEAGLTLQGWEVKSIRAGKANITDAYVFIKNGEAYVTNISIQALTQASSHVVCDPTRMRKLLMNKREIEELMGGMDRQGLTIVATAMYWKACWIKLEIYLARGKQDHDKRDAIKDRDWSRQKERIMKKG
ncbi:SsrA-binding protein [Glaciecola punicea ACAM 611]|jgi:SsrA-binding protein|uniref:SsrA-binding protein n=1 Tax=Glaciecola punicea ACAM 611 TaxID=1121923 RepID=H5T971_9ALTE|nr:SsrA-binding protein SmpB [Glaciecola punicea]OFA31717.1 SsrA-binding protein [Glaciecola punicea]GAB54848.1 SsrA-binding protein [Glaciecola punicea ACAM 611]